MSLAKDLLKEIDDVSAEVKESRSAVMRMAIRAGLPLVKRRLLEGESEKFLANPSIANAVQDDDKMRKFVEEMSAARDKEIGELREMMDELQISVKATFSRMQFSVEVNATPEQAFDLSADSVTFVNWFFREPQKIAFNPSTGTISFVRNANGVALQHQGKFLETIRPKHLSFRWGVEKSFVNGGEIFFNIAPDKSGCHITVTHELHRDGCFFADNMDATQEAMVRDFAKLLSGNNSRAASVVSARTKAPVKKKR